MLNVGTGSELCTVQLSSPRPDQVAKKLVEQVLRNYIQSHHRRLMLPNNHAPVASRPLTLSDASLNKLRCNV
jgi:hypothetical protein